MNGSGSGTMSRRWLVPAGQGGSHDCSPTVGEVQVPYWRLYCHVVWATRRRTPWLEGDAADIVEAAIRSHLHALRGLVHGVAVMPDHVHVAVSLPPSQLLSDAIGQIKGRSSNLVRVRHPRLADEGFSWQGDYGVISFGDLVQ